MELREQGLILKQAKSEKALAISAEERDLGILDRERTLLDRETDMVQRKRTLSRNGRKWRNDSKTWKNKGGFRRAREILRGERTGLG